MINSTDLILNLVNQLTKWHKIELNQWDAFEHSKRTRIKWFITKYDLITYELI